MKKLLYLFSLASFIFISCKKEVHSIVGIWEPTSVTIHIHEEEFTSTGQLLYSYDTTLSMTPEQFGVSGNIEFTNQSDVIITSNNGYIETNNYTISANTLTIIDSDGNSNNILTYTVSKTNLSLTMSITEIDGTTTNTREETIHCIKQ